MTPLPALSGVDCISFCKDLAMRTRLGFEGPLFIIMFGAEFVISEKVDIVKVLELLSYL